MEDEFSIPPEKIIVTEDFYASDFEKVCKGSILVYDDPTDFYYTEDLARKITCYLSYNYDTHTIPYKEKKNNLFETEE